MTQRSPIEILSQLVKEFQNMQLKVAKMENEIARISRDVAALAEQTPLKEDGELLDGEEYIEG